MRYCFGEYELNTATFSLERAGERVPVRNKPLDLLFYLVKNRHRVVTKSELLDRLWEGTAVAATSLTTAINSARNAVDDNGQSQHVIETTFGRGYRFVAPVVENHESPFAAKEPSPPDTSLARDVFVGRAEAETSLASALEDAERGRPRLVLIAGEMGIGKSTLVTRLIDLAASRGHRTVVAHCQAHSGAPPYWPWVETLRRLSDDRAREEFGKIGGLSPDLADLVPELRSLLTGPIEQHPLTPPQARFRLFDSACRFLRASARTQPTVVAVEDLHCADEDSLQLLRFLARSLGESNLLVIGTHRENELVGGRPHSERLAGLVREHTAVRIGLGPLSTADVGDYLRRTCGPGLPATAADALHARTGGNPFFLCKLVEFVLMAHGQEGLRDGAFVRELPADLREAIALQVAGLPDQINELLSTASALGHEFSLALLADVLGVPKETALERIGVAIASGVLGPVPDNHDRYRFAHFVVREALYERLPSLRRAELHFRVCQVLKTTDTTDAERVSELAFHSVAAIPVGDPRDALLATERAAAAASDQRAYDLAADLLDQALVALKEADPGDQQHMCDLITQLAYAQARAGHRELARSTAFHAASIARSLRDPVRLGTAALALDPGLLAIEVGVVDTDLIDLLRDAISGLGAAEADLHMRLLSRLAVALQWSEEEEAGESGLVATAAGVAKGLATRRAEIESLSVELWSRRGPDDLDTRLDIASRLVAVAEKDDEERALIHRLFLLTCLLERGDIRSVDREIHGFGEIARRLRQPQSLWYIRLLDTMRALLGGQFAQAQEHAHAFAQIAARLDDVNAEQSFGACIALARLETNQLDGLDTSMEAFCAKFPGHRMWEGARAFVYCELDRLDDARRALRSTRLRHLPKNAAWLLSTTVVAQVVGSIRAVEEAERQYELLTPYADRCAVVGFGTMCWGSVRRQLGRLAAVLNRWDESEEHFELGLEANAALGAWPWVAHTQYAYAEMLAARQAGGDRSRAAVLKTEAYDSARRLGMTLLMSRIERSF